MKGNASIAGTDKVTMAVEIGSDWFKAVTFNRRGSGLGKVLWQKIDEPGKAPAAVIASALHARGFGRGPALALLPRHMVNIRMLEFPSVDPKEIADMVELQAGRQTPHAMEEILYDFRILGAEREGYTRIMLVIVQSVLARQRYSVLEEAGLDLAGLSISTEGVWNWYVARAAKLGTDVALLDVDANYTDFCVIRGGRLTFTRSIPVGGDAWQTPDSEDRLFQETGRALETYRSENAGARIEKLIATGAGVPLDSLAAKIQAEFGVAVEKHSAWTDVPTLGDSPDQRRLSLTALVGAALRPQQMAIDLTPEAVVIRKTLTWQARSLTHFGILLMAVLCLMAMLLEGRIGRTYEAVQALKNETGKTRPEALRLEALQAKSRIVAARLDARCAPLNLLAEIWGLVPENAYCTMIQIQDEQQIQLKGNASSQAEVTRFVSALEGSPLLTNVKPTRTVTGKDKTEFEIVCTLEK
jgi:Tfp pilus assembly PilM family ATPase/Tfp pilus assembly protein PilN